MKGKYIITTSEIPILISEAMNHKDIYPKHWIISAGFFDYDSNNGFKCYGKSESLNINSRTEDSDVLNIFFKK